MADREERKAQAAKHISFVKGVFASETEASIEAAVIYEEGEGRELPIPEASADATETMVTTAFIPEAMSRFAKGKTIVVDPAGFTRPGGAYEDGAFGPEQIICSESNLYPILCGIKKAYHDQNRDYRRGQLFTDRAAYIPDVVFSRNGKVSKAGVVVIPEPMRVRALENQRSERECDNALATRIETFLRIAATNECETLVLGAFACGRLGYDADQVIGLLKGWFEAYPGVIPNVVFAVPRAQFAAFDAAFGKPVVEEAPAVEEKREDEDEFDLANIELPEGVTLRI